MRVERNRDAARADDRKKPVKAFPSIAAVDGDRLPRAKGDRLAKKSIDRANFAMQVGETKGAALVYGDFAIPLSPDQHIHQIGDREFAVSRKLIAPDEAHGAETGLRPQSLATQ